LPPVTFGLKIALAVPEGRNGGSVMVTARRIATACGLILLLATVFASAGPPTISGVIQSVDLDERSMTVKDPKAGEVVVVVPDDAVIVLDGDEKAVLDDLFEGDVVETATVRDVGEGKVALVKAVVSTTSEGDPSDEHDEDP